MIIYYKNKKMSVDVERKGFFGRIRGLMFRFDKKNLLFDFKRDMKIPLHSFFVFYDFLVLWLDDKNNVIEYRMARPFQLEIIPGRKYRKILELPFSDDNKPVFDLIVGKAKV